MLSEVSDAISACSKSSNKLNNNTFKCSTKDCSGFSYSADVCCTVCGSRIKPVPDYEIAISKDLEIEQKGVKRRIIERSVNSDDTSTFMYPMVVLSLGKLGAFDARLKPCIISSDSISFHIKIEHLWTPVIIYPSDVSTLLFCEDIQVIFIRPTAPLQQRLLTLINSNRSEYSTQNDLSWVIIVLEGIPQVKGLYQPSYANLILKIFQLEVFCSNVRLFGGHCLLELSHSVAQNLLTANGVRLARNDSLHVRSLHSGDIRQATTASTTCKAIANSHPVINSPTPSISTAIQSSYGSSTARLSMNSGAILPPVPDTSNSQTKLEPNKMISRINWFIYPKKSDTLESNEPVILTLDGSSITSEIESDANDYSISQISRFIYRPPNSADAIPLSHEDVACLSPGSFLNDAIINFYLKYLFFERLTPFQRQATHLFNTFFYSRLSALQDLEPPNTLNTLPFNGLPQHPSSPVNSERLMTSRHQRVAKWSRRVDLFSKDYIIIPINENSHWFLGLVCYPWMAGMVSYTALYEAFAYNLCQLTPAFVAVDSMKVHTEEVGVEVLSVQENDKRGEAFDRWRRRRLAWLRRRGINAMPCILLFDSIPSHARVSNLHIIRDYLQVEWNTRRSERDGSLRFNKDTIRGFSPRVPSQSNLVDCGIFLLHYVEMFFTQPVESYTKDYFQNKMASWFVSEKLGQKRAVIIDLIDQLRRRTAQPIKV